MLDGTSRYPSIPNLILGRKPEREPHYWAPNHTAQEYCTAVWPDQESMLAGNNPHLNWVFSIFLFTNRGCVLLSRPLY